MRQQDILIKCILSLQLPLQHIRIILKMIRHLSLIYGIFTVVFKTHLFYNVWFIFGSDLLLAFVILFYSNKLQ